MKNFRAIVDVDFTVRDLGRREVIDLLKEVNAEYSNLRMEVESLRGKVDKVTPAVMDKVKYAFWLVFHRSGKHNFSQLEDAEEVTRLEFERLRIALEKEFD